MRVRGLLVLVLALVIVGLLVKKQMAATRAPMSTLATVGRCSSQLMATWGTVRPVSSATSCRASTTANSRSSGTGGANCAVSCRRLPSGIGWPRRILPVRRPQASGLQTMVPTPWSRPSGISSHSKSRPASE